MLNRNAGVIFVIVLVASAGIALYTIGSGAHPVATAVTFGAIFVPFWLLAALVLFIERWMSEYKKKLRSDYDTP
ncbi:MAG: hypothetical protein AAB421_04820 [Patescibacteria group bacterium]